MDHETERKECEANSFENIDFINAVVFSTI